MIADNEILTNIQKYYAIVRDHAYNISTDNRQKQLSTLRVKQEAWSNDALQYIYNCYVKEKYFDELDLLADGGEVLTECKLVVNVVFPGYLDNLKQIMTIMLDFDNMIALSPQNYVQWKQRTLQLNDAQRQLIERKEQIILKRYKLKLSDVMFYRSKQDNSLAVQRTIQEICADVENYIVENYIKTVQKNNKKAHINGIEVYNEKGKLVVTYNSGKEAAIGMCVNESAVSEICNRKRKFAKSKLDGQRYCFRFCGDTFK